MSRLLRAGLLAAIALAVAAFGLAAPRGASADPNPKSALVTLAPVIGTRNVEMAAQIFDVSVLESGDSTVLAGQLTFKLHNTDRLTRTQAIVGFPFWGGGATEFNERSFSQFAVTLDGVTQTLAAQMQNLRIGNETRNVRWLTFPITMTEDDRATVEVKFRQDLGDAALPSIVMAQAPAINWKNYVGSARFTIRFPALTTPEQFRVQAPAGGVFDGRALTWLYSEYNPDAPIVLQLVKPRIWREIAQARAALSQGGDARAALALGAQFVTLARASQSGADFAQAAAAYQRVPEGDALAPSAALESARLYEARLRGDFGPVADAGIARSAALQEWQRALTVNPGSPEARDAVAQHAFASAQGLRRARQFAGSLAMLDIARAANSTRITRALLDAEARAANAGLIGLRMDAARWEEVLKQIDADAIGAEAKAERAAHQPRFWGVLVSANITATGQVVATRLTPFPGPSPAHEQLLTEWLERARRSGADGEWAPDGGGYVLTLRLSLQTLPAADLSAAPELLPLRESVSASQIVVTRTQALLSVEDALAARYTLAESKRVALARVAEIERLAATLSAPSGDETAELVRAVRLRALEQYRIGWQSVAATSGVRVSWQRSDLVLENWDLQAGETRNLESRHTSYNVPAIAALGALILGGAALAIVGASVVFRRALRRRDAA